MKDRGSVQCRLDTGDYYIKWETTPTYFLPSDSKGSFSKSQAWKSKTKTFTIKRERTILDIVCISGVGGQERFLAEAFFLWQKNAGYAELSLSKFVQKCINS